MVSTIAILAVTLLGAGSEIDARFTDVRLMKPYDRCFLADPALFDAAGCLVLEMPNENRVLLAIASVALEDMSAQVLIDAEKVCRLKAFREVIESTEGVQIVSVQRSEDGKTVKYEHGGRKIESVSKYFDMTKTRLSTFARDLPMIGHWKSKDRTRLYIAIGTLLDKAGNRIPIPVGGQ